MFRKRHFLVSLLLFILLNSSLYLFILSFNKVVPFNLNGYYEGQHYIDDPRTISQGFNFLRSLNVWDGQWYTKIAQLGYPSKKNGYEDGSSMGDLTYAFFPLYPTLLAAGDYLFQNTELTAFILSNILLLANFFSLYYIVGKLYGEDIALRTIWLLFLFPFSIFFRSFYTEGIFLFLLSWYSYFLIKKRWVLSSLFAALLFVARPNGSVAGLILFVSLLSGVFTKKIPLMKAFLCFLISCSLFVGWLYFCYYQTGDPLFWIKVQKHWFTSTSILEPVTNNVLRILSFIDLPFHDFQTSKVDISVLVLVLIILTTSRKFLKPQLWWISFLIWIVPFLVKDTMSFSRFQTVSFPLFIYLAHLLKGVKFGIVVTAFLLLLFFVAIYFVNWYWVG